MSCSKHVLPDGTVGLSEANEILRFGLTLRVLRDTAEEHIDKLNASTAYSTSAQNDMPEKLCVLALYQCRVRTKVILVINCRQFD